jgi:hypothetical protein
MPREAPEWSTIFFQRLQTHSKPSARFLSMISDKTVSSAGNMGRRPLPILRLLPGTCMSVPLYRMHQETIEGEIGQHRAVCIAPLFSAIATTTPFCAAVWEQRERVRLQSRLVIHSHFTVLYYRRALRLLGLNARHGPNGPDHSRKSRSSNGRPFRRDVSSDRIIVAMT